MSGTDELPADAVERTTTRDRVEVLLVDDDEAWVTSTGQILEQQRESFVVETATDLSAASAAFREDDPDCVVSDYQLERGTGLDLLAEVRDLEPDRPFILITGQGDESVASDAIGREVTDYIPKRSLGGRDDLLARRVEAAVDSYRTQRALDRERRSKTAILDILTATTTETELYQQFCTQLVTERGYDCAWIGGDDGSGRPVPRAAAGREGFLDDLLGPDGHPPREDPSWRALDSDELVVDRACPAIEDGPGDGRRSGSDRTVDDDGDDAPVDWQAVAADYGFERVLAVPVRHEGVRFGVLVACTEDAAMVTERERTALAEFADAVGYALRTTEQKRSLMSAGDVAVDVEIDDPSVPVVALAETLPDPAAIEIQSAVPRDDGTALYVADVSGVSTATLEDCAASVETVRSVAVDDTTSPLRCEVVVSAPTPEGVLASHGARFERTVVDDTTATVSVRVPDDGTVTTVRDVLESEYEDATVSTIWTGRDGTSSTDDPTADLTDRQLEVIRHAFQVGYFERPRDTSATELAEHFDVARATVTQHLRAAERKLLEKLF